MCLLVAYGRLAADDPNPDPGGGGLPAPGDGKTEILLKNPQVSGTGPYTVVVEGTLSLSKSETAYIGTKASVIHKGVNNNPPYNASVQTPKGNPQPGKAAVPVIYTWTSLPKGGYQGDAVLEYKDANGDGKSVKTNVNFKIN